MEIMIAVLLLAICAVPMGEAIRNGIAASTVADTRARELRCVKNTMETVLATPYQTLWNAAPGQGTLVPLALPLDAACDNAPPVSVARVEYDSATKKLLPLDAAITGERLESPLLYVSVGAKNGYAFTTLVAR
jgi:hypothetical protein